MAIASNYSEPRTGPAQAGNGSDDAAFVRDREIRRAKRHTLVVKTLRFLLPTLSVIVVVAYGLSAFRTAEWVNAIPALPIPEIFPDKLTMDNPRYTGFNKDGSSYVVTAKTAAQDFKRPKVILLDGISGELVDEKNTKTLLEAVSGEFHSQKKTLQLDGGIDIRSTDGMRAELKTATIETGTGIIQTTEPVFVAMRSSTLRSNQMTIWQKKKEMLFSGDVKAHLKQEETAKDAAPKPARAADGAKKQTGLFADNRSPIDISSETLAVSNAENRAVFSGNVVAIQGDARIATRELEVHFEPADKKAAGGQLQGPTQGSQLLAAASGKVKRVVSKHPVLITRGSDQQVTSRGAEFIVAEERAILDGQVVIVSGKDRRASSDRAELQQRDETIVLEGNVVVSQAKNSLRGRRLFVDRKRGRMTLTSPPGGGAGPGRVSATLHRDGEPAKPKAKSKKKSQTAGVGAVAAFKTDPTAPINIEADSLDVDNDKHEAVFRGGVIAKQGTFKIESATLTTRYTGTIDVADPAMAQGGDRNASKKSNADPEINRIVARDNVVVTSQSGQSARGDWAEFDVAGNSVELGGAVTLRQGKNEIRGTTLSIDMDTGRSVIKTDGSAHSDSSWVSAVDGAGATAGNKKRSGPPPGFNQQAGRPRAVFFPFQLKKKKSAPAKPATSGSASPATGGSNGAAADSGASSWSATAAPAN